MRKDEKMSQKQKDKIIKSNKLTWKNKSKEEKKKISEHRMEEKNPIWAGDKVKRVALHQFVYSRLGKPKLCEHCKTTKAKRFDWANKSRKYKRDLNDWIRLCRSCHIKYDRG